MFCIFILNIFEGVFDINIEIVLKKLLCKRIFFVLIEYGFILCEWELECVGMRGDGSYEIVLK